MYVDVVTNFVDHIQAQSIELGSHAICQMAAYDKKCKCCVDAGQPIN